MGEGLGVGEGRGGGGGGGGGDEDWTTLTFRRTLLIRAKELVRSCLLGARSDAVLEQRSEKGKILYPYFKFSAKDPAFNALM